MNSDHSPTHRGGLIQCDVCQATFTRQEHLNRHIRSHTTEKPFQCLQCGKSFTRLDVLHRHNQSHVSKPLGDRSGKKFRACKECAVSRVRCSRGDPCERCSQREIQCIYPVAEKRKTQSSLDRRHSSPRPTTSISSSAPGSPANSSQLEPSRPPVDSAGVSAPSTAPHTLGLDPGMQPLNPLSSTSDSTNHWGWLPLQSSGTLPGASTEVINGNMPVFDSQILEKDLNEWVGNMASVNWLSPQGPDFFPDAQLDDLLLLGISAGVAGQGETVNGLENYGLEKTNDAPPLLENSNVASVPALPHQFSGDQQTPVMEPVHSASGETTADTPVSRPPEGTYYVEGSAGRAPFQGKSSWRASRYSPWGSNLGSTGRRTPVSERAESSCGLFVSEMVYKDCVRSFAAEANRLEIGPDMASIPSLGEMQDLVQLYFVGFHPTYPFLLKHPSIFIPSSHWILLLAVAATGSRYSSKARYHLLGESLIYVVDQILCNRLNNPVVGDGNQLWNPVPEVEEKRALDFVTLQAALLNYLSLLHCGQNGAVQRALNRRYHLIEAYRSLNLLSVAGKPSSEIRGEADPEDVFRHWLDSESLIRTGWMIWKLPPNLGDLSSSVLIFAICRRNQEASAQHQTELTFWSPNAEKQPRQIPRPTEETWPPAIPSLSKWRNSACDCFDILHWNANSIAARVGGWEHPTILHLHIARLMLLAPVQHIQKLAVYPLAPLTSPNSIPAAHMTARYHTLRWAIRDQYKARLCIVHAGALLWHVRRYSSNSFLEPFGVYAATLIIWAYSISMQTMRSHNLPQAIVPEPQPLPHHSTRQEEPSIGETVLESEDSDCETEPTVIQLDRPCDDEIVQAYVRFGHNMSARMHRVGDICEASAPRRILKQGIRLLTSDVTDPDGVRPGWGVEKSYIDSLNTFITSPVVSQKNDHLSP
ncbi:uncharacterized protein N7525_011191 [Penicillium rubens]|uniref:uncharacterized protein n=1 Tax=Penicillium rubens TaxID=1108849 RepID=UPI002A59CF8B|nr:uncharacterized protein N7525_011191 [Penicillium rubens]KAJ5821907.1 hypothetical protein N7525_011191 [Penicillium rubens]